MSIAAAILGGGVISALGANSAANKQKSAANTANALQTRVYEEQVNRLQPFLDAGMGGLQNYLYELGLTQDAPEGYTPMSMSPAANFLLTQGRDTIEAGAASQGGLYSGATLQGLEDYRQNVALSDRDRQLNRLLGLTGLGQSAAAGQGAAGVNYATNYGNNVMQGANAASAGIMGMGNAFNDAVGNYVGYQNYSSLLNKLA